MGLPRHNLIKKLIKIEVEVVDNSEEKIIIAQWKGKRVSSSAQRPDKQINN